MANGSDPTSGNSGNGKPFSNISAALENRVVLVMLAASLGVGGNLAIVKGQPDTVRPDPFTGTEGRELSNRIARLERLQALDDQHRSDATGGYARIRSLESRCTLNDERIHRLQKDVDQLEADLQ